MFFLIFFYGIDRDLRGYIVWEVKLARADTAERYTLQTVLLRFIQTGDITAFEQLAVLVCEPAADNRSYCVDNILARQVISGCDFRLTCRLLVTLLPHHLITGITELNARKGMDCIYNLRHHHT